MTDRSNLEDLLRAIDPLSDQLRHVNTEHREIVWNEIVSRKGAARLQSRRRFVGASLIAVLFVVTSLVVGLSPDTAPLSAAAATLQRAAKLDASAASFPSLTSGQYYYAESRVTMNCSFAIKTSSGWGPWITYVSNGSIQSWTDASGPGQVVITPTPVGQGGSHFATTTDETNWVSEGKPFVPCALVQSASHSGGAAETIEGFAGFGFILGWAQQGKAVPSLSLGSQETKIVLGANIAALPDNVIQIQAMLANGEINSDGSTSPSPRVCPVGASIGAGPGCDTNQQLELIEQLLQLPNASAKLGSVLYKLLEQMPGARVATNTTDSFGNSGITLTVPIGGLASGDSEFQVLIDPLTGSLLSSTQLDRVNVDGTTSNSFSPVASIGYGAISVVSGIGVFPSTVG